jgi:hypothetical protein
MRVARIELKEIGPFDDAVIEIPAPAEGQRGELVIFEGPNGSGKTTIAEMIACAASTLVSRANGFNLSAPAGSAQQRRRSPDGSFAVFVTDGEVTGTAFASAPATAGAIVPARFSLDQSTPFQRAAFAYRGHQDTPNLATNGPSEIPAHPLAGALSFGRFDAASAHFGQLLTNIKHEQAMAFLEAHREGLAPDRRDELTRLAASRHDMIDTIARALSAALLRTVRIEFLLGQQAPVVMLDGEPIPFHFAGEGMRSTLAWLSDLLVRLHRITWANPDISPLEQDFWLILDEIDESLHPTMQMRILPALRRLFPNARMYVTTHSPFVVASAAEGYVFSINPDARHRVSGTIEPRRLEPGQSLEWVVEEIFGAETGFIDPWTRDALRAHRADIGRLRRKEDLGGEGWRLFLDRRAKLMHLNEQVQTVVAMQEVPVQSVVEAKVAAGA